MSDSAFSSLALSPAMLANLEALGYSSMTPIQAQSLPRILEGKDLIAQARTGSGKTAAFAIGLLNPLNHKYFGCQALVLCPTRELADQVAREIRRVARGTENIKVLTLCGGQPIGPQLSSLEHGAQIVVGTPGRILKHLKKGSLSLDGLNTLVLDEADRMLDMGFYDSIAEVVRQTPERRQTLLFSATFPAAIKQLANTVMKTPEQVTVASHHEQNAIEQRFYEIDAAERFNTVARALRCFRPSSCVAFCFTRKQCDELVTHLRRDGIDARALHGDMEQRDRDQVLVLFSQKSLPVLVATDVAARGLDIEDLELVINVELGKDVDTHIHRVGRTGRAGRSGLAISLVAPSETQRALAIEDRQQAPLNWHPASSLKPQSDAPLTAPMRSLCIAAGRKDKLRAGDILGALTGDAGIAGARVGKITLFDHQAFVAVEQDVAEQALERLANGRIKGRSLRVRLA